MGNLIESIGTLLQGRSPRRRAAVAALAVLVALTVALSVARCSYVHAPGAQPAASPGAGAPGAGAGPVEGTGAPLEAWAPASGAGGPKGPVYTGEKAELLGLLASNVWASGDEAQFVEFDGEAVSFREFGRYEGGVQGFEISDILTEDTAGHEALVHKMTAAIRTQSGEVGLLVVVRYTQTAQGGMNLQTERSSWTLSSSLLHGAKEYALKARQAGSVSVTGVTEDAAALVGGDVEGLEGAVAAFGAAYVPTASGAACTGKADVDLVHRRVKLHFEFNNASKMKVTVVYDMDAKGFSVTEGLS